MRPRLVILSLLAAVGVAVVPARASAQWNHRYNSSQARNLERQRERAAEQRERAAEQRERTRELTARRAEARREMNDRLARQRVEREFARQDRLVRVREQTLRSRPYRPFVYRNRW